jgi:hypothetical protein
MDIDGFPRLLSELEPDWMSGFLWRTVARLSAAPCGAMSSTLRVTTSQPRLKLSFGKQRDHTPTTRVLMVTEAYVNRIRANPRVRPMCALYIQMSSGI